MRRLVYGIGLNDVPGMRTEKGSLNDRIYALWHRMLKRCYSEKFLRERPSYRGCEVCDRWKQLSHFVEDVVEIPNYKLWEEDTKLYCLDKDLLVSGNKVYGPRTVIFVRKSENSFETHQRNPQIAGNANLKRTFELAHKANARKIKVTMLETGEERVFSSGSECERQLGYSHGTVSHWLRGRVKVPKMLKIERI